MSKPEPNKPLPIPRDDLLDSPLDLLQFVQQELFKQYEKVYLEDVLGPALYGDRANYEIYQDVHQTWQIRAAPGYKPNQVIGMMNFLAELGEED